MALKPLVCLFPVLLLLSLGCKDPIETQDTPCQSTEETLNPSAAFDSWIPPNQNDYHLNIYSAKGLSQTINISSYSSQERIYRGPCNSSVLINTRHLSYYSGLYHHQFKISVGVFSALLFDRYPEGEIPSGDSTAIQLRTFSDNNLYTNLVLLDAANTRALCFYRMPNQVNQPIKQVVCDTCMHQLGTYNTGKKTYKDVYRLSDPVTLINGDSGVITTYLISEKYGIIQYELKNGDQWKINP